MIRITLLTLLTFLLLACGLPAQAETQMEGAAEQTDSPPPSTGGPAAGAAYVELFHGDSLVEQKILHNGVIVRATMASLASDVIDRGNSTYGTVLFFTLNVHEYLKGTGPTSIMAVWVDGDSYRYDTRAEADVRKAEILASRDSQWDAREAVVFLYDGPTGFEAAVTELLQRADHFFLGFGHQYFSDDQYSIHSERNRVWLPAASAGGASGTSSNNATEYLLDVSAASGGASGASATPTITLGNLKTRIQEVTAEYNGGDGSAAYKECVEDKYAHKRMARHFPDYYTTADNHLNHALTSGQPANRLLFERNWFGSYPDKKARTWFEGGDAALFNVLQGDTTQNDLDGDGVITAGVDEVRYMEYFRVTRPLPAGVYRPTRKEVWAWAEPCNFVLSFDMTVTVTAPAGTVHEAFFDPVTIGTGVGADGTNGVLKPTGFSVGGTSTSITGLKWENGTVVLTLSPYAALTGRTLDVIALNGAVSLSLAVSSATADTTAGTLTWTRSAQPWQNGDKLMLRISGR